MNDARARALAKAAAQGDEEARDHHRDWGWCPKCGRHVHASHARLIATGDGRARPVGLAPGCPGCRSMLVRRPAKQINDGQSKEDV